jgi:leucyl aminopeptidase
VVKSRAGKTVTIEHTDAEGRLILADALDYARTELKPRQVLSFATLTTASLRQHGPYWTPVHFAGTQQQAVLQQAAHTWGEELMFWPEFIPFFEANKGRISDLTNMGRLPGHANIGSGSNVAAHFLRQFVTGPYMHIDIFNSIWNWSDEYPGPKQGATGAVFNPLFAALREL